MGFLDVLKQQEITCFRSFEIITSVDHKMVKSQIKKSPTGGDGDSNFFHNQEVKSLMFF